MMPMKMACRPGKKSSREGPKGATAVLHELETNALRKRLSENQKHQRETGIIERE